MAAPTNTYNSSTDLSLGSVPQVEDPILYTELLDIHNAIETLLTINDDQHAVFTAYIAKQRNNTDVTFAMTPYTVLVTDGTIRVDATAGDIVVVMHPVADLEGYMYNIKRIDSVFANKVTLLGEGTELIDGRANGINISTKSSYPVKATLTGWDIL